MTRATALLVTFTQATGSCWAPPRSGSRREQTTDGWFTALSKVPSFSAVHRCETCCIGVDCACPVIGMVLGEYWSSRWENETSCKENSSVKLIVVGELVKTFGPVINRRIPKARKIIKTTQKRHPLYAYSNWRPILWLVFCFYPSSPCYWSDKESSVYDGGTLFGLSVCPLITHWIVWKQPTLTASRVLSGYARLWIDQCWKYKTQAYIAHSVSYRLNTTFNVLHGPFKIYVKI